ncbi:MAG TPA: APC family permease [Solirubrobacteraceae bacterium]|nr:APC family permease [Solirubrobacteraceae bacterium]
MALTTERTQETVIGSFEQSDRELRKTMSFTHLLFMSMGAIIGSGWLLATLGAASTTGPAAIVSWVIGGVFIVFIALTYAEISGMLPRTGGIVRYPVLTHGNFTGWLIGWTYWLSAISVPAIEAEAVVTYVSSQTKSGTLTTVSSGVTELKWPLGILFAIGLMLLFWLLNFFGVRLLSEVNRWVTWWKLIIPTITFIFLFTVLRGANFSSYGGFAPLGTSSIFEAMSTSGIIFAYLGFRQALEYAGEARRPQRDVPLATIGSVVIAMVVYVGLQVAFIGGLRWGNAGVHPGDWAGLSASKWANAPLYDALKAAGVGWLASYAYVLLVDGGISPSGTGWIYLGTATRTNYGLSVHGMAPKSLQTMNRWKVPWVSTIVSLVIGCLFLVPEPSWYKLVGFITSTTALTYIMGGVGLPVFRRYASALRRPFRLGWAEFWSPVSFLAAMLIVYFSGYATLITVYCAVFIGMPLFIWYFAPARGWVKPGPAALLGLVFLAAWVYIAIEGGWVLRVNPPVKGAWGFGTYDVAQSADVLFFCVGLWALCNGEGRRQVLSSAWFVIMLLCVLPLSYYGAFGPQKTPSIAFPWDTLIALAIGLVAYYWGVASGLNTEELQDIVKRAGEPAPLAPAGDAAGGQPMAAPGS